MYNTKVLGIVGKPLLITKLIGNYHQHKGETTMPDTPTPPATIPAVQSTAVWAGAVGMIVFALRIFKGWNIDESQISGVVDNAMNVKGSVLGIVASLGIIVSRVKAVNFDKGIFKTKTFWASIGKIAGIALTIFGVGDNEVNMEAVAGNAFDSITLCVATLSSVAAIYGRATATTPITTVVTPTPAA